MSKVKYTTMAGTANYPWLQPGRPDTAFDVEGKYKTELRMSATDAKDLVSVITGLRDEFPKAKHERVRIPFRTDEETEPPRKNDASCAPGDDRRSFPELRGATRGSALLPILEIG